MRLAGPVGRIKSLEARGSGESTTCSETRDRGDHAAFLSMQSFVGGEGKDASRGWPKTRERDAEGGEDCVAAHRKAARAHCNQHAASAARSTQGSRAEKETEGRYMEGETLGAASQDFVAALSH